MARRCSKCTIEKTLSEFHKSKKSKDGCQSWCKECHSKRQWPYRKKTDAKRAAQRRYENKNKDEIYLKVRNRNLLKNFNITNEQYEELLRQQDYRCAVCLKHVDEFNKRLAVDHDHKTNEIFGLLCAYDNHKFIGRNRDPERYRRAADYLEQGTGLYVPKKKKKRKKK